MFTYNSAISACSKAAHWESALRIFQQEMRSVGIPADATTYAGLMVACAKGMQRERAQYFLRLRMQH